VWKFISFFADAFIFSGAPAPAARHPAAPGELTVWDGGRAAGK
jgi:hypothetical protein